MCTYTTSCIITCVVTALIWFIASSTLLYFCWNKVIAHITKWPQIRIAQAILFLATVIVLFAPCAYMKMKRHHHFHGGMMSHHGMAMSDMNCCKDKSKCTDPCMKTCEEHGMKCEEGSTKGMSGDKKCPYESK